MAYPLIPLLALAGAGLYFATRKKKEKKPTSTVLDVPTVPDSGWVSMESCSVMVEVSFDKSQAFAQDFTMDTTSPETIRSSVLNILWAAMPECDGKVPTTLITAQGDKIDFELTIDDLTKRLTGLGDDMEGAVQNTLFGFLS